MKETKEQKIKNNILDLFYINGNLALKIDDFINDYTKQNLADKRFLMLLIKNHQKNYNIILSKIVAELEKELKELENGNKN